MPADEIISVQESRFLLDTGLDGPDGKPLEKELLVYPVSWNGILFATAVLATPWRLLRDSWRWLLVAAFVLLASHVLYFSLSAMVQVAQLYESNGMPFLAPGWRSFLGKLAQGYSLTLGNLLPFLLMVPVVLGARRKHGRRRRRTRKITAAGRVGRNDPCPCGSGRKYKHCCMRD